MTRIRHLQLRVAGHPLMLAALTAAWIGSSLAQQTPASDVAAASAASWIPSGSLNVARSEHTATLLPSGQVLVVGGMGYTFDAQGSRSILDSAELYDPASGTWSFTGRLNNPRVGHTATLLRDGRVLVAGSLGSPGAGAELYDPQTGMWTPTGSMGTPRDGQTATLLADGRVLVAGGDWWGLPSSAELYDPATGTWSPTGNLVQTRYGHAMTRLQDGRVLVIGGSDDGDLASVLPDAELYDPDTGIWRRTGSLVVGRYTPTVTLLPDGRVLVAGGYAPLPPTSLQTAELYDPASGAWTRTGDLNVGRQDASTTLLPNGAILVAGGSLWDNVRRPFRVINLSSAESYDPSAGTWQLAGTLVTARHSHTATLLQDGRVLVAGGAVLGSDFRETPLAVAELYGNFPPGTIGAGYTGAWFDPTQNGHGLLVEVLPDQRFLAAWFTFNPAGTQQSWFLGVGSYSGNTATISHVLQPTGGRWIPDFDPTKIVNNAWGSLTFTFTDCNHGEVDFKSTLGYGSGSMNLTRLTRPAGLNCS